MTFSATSSRPGYLYVILAAILFALSGSIAKFLFNQGLSPFQLVQMRTTLAASVLWLYLALRRPNLLRVQRRDLPYFLILGTAGIGAAQFFYFAAISRVHVAVAILLHYLGPVLVALYAWLIAGERLGGRTLLAVVGAVLGCALSVGVHDLNLFNLNRPGIAAGLLAAAAFATYSLLGEYGMRRYPSWTVLAFAMLSAACLWNVLHPPLSAFFQNYTARQWACILFIGIFGTVLPFGLYFEGIHRIRPTHASVTATLEPIAAAAISYLFLGETLSPLQTLGGLMVITAVILLPSRQREDERTHHGARPKSSGVADPP